MKVLMIAPRGLNLGHVGCYGNQWIDTPTLDRLAAEGVVFDHHYADRPHPQYAHLSWRTGRHHFPQPCAEDLTEPTSDILKLLRAADVRCVLIHDESRPVPEDFTTGWDEVVRVPSEAEEGSSLERSLEAAVEAVRQLDPAGQWLVWLDLGTVLPPWDVPDEFVARYFDKPPTEDEEEEEEEAGLDEDYTLAPLPDPMPALLDPDDDETPMRVQRSFAAAVTYLDSGLELLLEELQDDDLYWIVTSDRGQPLGEHGAIGDVRPWPHEELVHLPLILRSSDASHAGRRISALTQPVDLFATLLDLFGVAIPVNHGHSLLPLLRGETEQIRTYACSGHQIGDEIEWALRTSDWAFLLPMTPYPEDRAPRRPQLYLKPDDRWEVNDLVQHHLERAEQFETVLRGFVEASRQAGPLTPPELPE